MTRPGLDFVAIFLVASTGLLSCVSQTSLLDEREPTIPVASAQAPVMGPYRCVLSTANAESSSLCRIHRPDKSIVLEPQETSRGGLLLKGTLLPFPGGLALQGSLSCDSPCESRPVELDLFQAKTGIYVGSVGMNIGVVDIELTRDGP